MGAATEDPWVPPRGAAANCGGRLVTVGQRNGDCQPPDLYRLADMGAMLIAAPLAPRQRRQPGPACALRATAGLDGPPGFPREGRRAPASGTKIPLAWVTLYRIGAAPWPLAGINAW